MKNPMDEFIRLALVFAKGSMKGAAEKLRWTVAELLEHLARTPHMREFLAEHREGLADDAERYLENAVEESCPWAIKYTLKTLGASRGYGDPLDANQATREPSPTPTPEPPTAEQQAEIESLLQGKTEAEVAAALEETRGNVARMALKLQMRPADAKKIIAARPALQKIIVDVRERLIDKAELALHGALGEKKPWAIKFALGTLGRSRGYRRPPTRIPGQTNAAPPQSPPPSGSTRMDEWPSPGADAPMIHEPPPMHRIPETIDPQFLPEILAKAKKAGGV